MDKRAKYELFLYVILLICHIARSAPFEMKNDSENIDELIQDSRTFTNDGNEGKVSEEKEIQGNGHSTTSFIYNNKNSPQQSALEQEEMEQSDFDKSGETETHVSQNDKVVQSILELLGYFPDESSHGSIKHKHKCDHKERVDERQKRSIWTLEDIERLCTTQKETCMTVLQQFNEWRQQHGYPAYTGVWKVGR